MPDESVFSARDRATLTVVCDAFHPRLTAQPGDDAELFATGSSDIGVARAAEEAIALLPMSEQLKLRRLLRLLDNPLFALAACGAAHRVTTMTSVQQEQLLRSLSNSSLADLRTGFHALKRLSSFLFYSSAGANGKNRAWDAIGYRPSSCPPTQAMRLELTTVQRDQTIDADVCVVGSGAGGGVVAAALAAKGLHVVVLEAGPGLQAGDFEQRELEGTQNLYLDHGLTASRDLGVAILAGSCLGGGTTVNWQTCLRTPDDVRDEWAERSGRRLFAEDRFSRALDDAWTRVGASTDESFVNGNNAPLQRGGDALGYSWKLISRNSRHCDSSQCGYCTFGCRLGGKQSTTVTYLQDAQRSGDCTIIADCTANRVTIRNGTVDGVVARARDASGTEFSVTVRAPRVVVAAGGIASPALLLRSGIELPALGRNLYLHPTTAIAGLYDERMEPWSGPPQTIMCDQFVNVDGNYGFRLETAPTHPGLLALALPWTSAVHHRRLMQRSAHASAIIALTRDADGGRVRVARDGSTVVDYVPARAEQRRIRLGIAAAIRVHVAAGATEVHTLHAKGMSYRPGSTAASGDVDAFCDRVLDAPVARNRSFLASAHQMGTCRIGRDAQTAVCDDRGEVFGVKNLFVADASAFPASSGVNPMITVMALAACIADGVEH